MSHKAKNLKTKPKQLKLLLAVGAMVISLVMGFQMYKMSAVLKQAASEEMTILHVVNHDIEKLDTMGMIAYEEGKIEEFKQIARLSLANKSEKLLPYLYYHFVHVEKDVEGLKQFLYYPAKKDGSKEAGRYMAHLLVTFPKSEKERKKGLTIYKNFTHKKSYYYPAVRDYVMYLYRTEGNNRKTKDFAKNLLRIATKAGYTDAHHQLAILYYRDTDIKQAVKHLTLAAQKQHPAALEDLALLNKARTLSKQKNELESIDDYGVNLSS